MFIQTALNVTFSPNFGRLHVVLFHLFVYIDLSALSLIFIYLIIYIFFMPGVKGRIRHELDYN